MTHDWTPILTWLMGIIFLVFAGFNFAGIENESVKRLGFGMIFLAIYVSTRLDFEMEMIKYILRQIAKGVGQ